MMKNFRLYTIYFLLTFAFSGCMEETIPTATDGEVTITIRVPGADTGNNRAITQGGTEDNRVDRVDVLLFDNANPKLYRGRVWSTVISGTGNSRTFTVKVPHRDSGNYDLLVLANAENIVDAAVLTVGTTTLTAVEGGLLEESITPGTGWNAVPGSTGYKPFPMWGKHENLNPSATNTLHIEPVRMLAKINVSFGSAAVAAKLEIDEITLVNYNTRGLLTSRLWDGTPRMPDPAADATLSLGFANGIPYTVTATDRADRENLVRDRIFLFEAAKPIEPGNTTQRINSVSLIIRGIYKGGDPDNTTPTYYRIDMANSAGAYFDIVRNHFYEVVITGITGSGYTTGQEAFAGKPFNIITTIDAWNEDGMNIHRYDGRYQITVDFDEFTFSSALTSSQPLRIYTDFPNGWKITDASPWLTVTPNAGEATSASATVQVSTEGSPISGTRREGSFYIEAGNLRKEIKVVQNDTVWAQGGALFSVRLRGW